MPFDGRQFAHPTVASQMIKLFDGGRGWTTNTLYNPQDNRYCMLGAIAAVVGRVHGNKIGNEVIGRTVKDPAYDCLLQAINERCPVAAGTDPTKISPENRVTSYNDSFRLLTGWPRVAHAMRHPFTTEAQRQAHHRARYAAGILPILKRMDQIERTKGLVFA